MSPWTLRGAAGQDPENKISTSTEFLNFCDWFVRSIANDKHTTCAEYTLLQANVPSNSNQDRKQALELKNAWMARYKKEFAPSGQAAATTAAVADKAAGRNVYNMLMVRFSGDVECKLKGVKDKHDADLDAYEEQEDGDGIEHPGNLATLIWEAPQTLRPISTHQRSSQDGDQSREAPQTSRRYQRQRQARRTYDCCTSSAH